MTEVRARSRGGGGAGGGLRQRGGAATRAQADEVRSRVDHRSFPSSTLACTAFCLRMSWLLRSLVWYRANVCSSRIARMSVVRQSEQASTLLCAFLSWLDCLLLRLLAYLHDDCRFELSRVTLERVKSVMSFHPRAVHAAVRHHPNLMSCAWLNAARPVLFCHSIGTLTLVVRAGHACRGPIHRPTPR